MVDFVPCEQLLQKAHCFDFQVMWCKSVECFHKHLEFINGELGASRGSPIFILFNLEVLVLVFSTKNIDTTHSIEGRLALRGAL